MRQDTVYAKQLESAVLGRTSSDHAVRYRGAEDRGLHDVERN